MSRNPEYVPAALRKQVSLRASYVCEYCLLPEIDSYYGFEIDHIISLKHGGRSMAPNLVYSCPDCNRNKGSDLASIDWNTNQIVRFFNPRIDLWNEHFRFVGGLIEPITVIGKVTATIFKFNEGERPDERFYYLSDN
jgi:hypothetical protein